MIVDLTFALVLEGVLITNAVSQFPRPGLMQFLKECEVLFGEENICIFTTVDETRFREVATGLVYEKYAPEWFFTIRYIEWVGEHKDLRFVDDDINRVIIIDDYPPYIKSSQKHRLLQINQYLDNYTHEAPDMSDIEFERVLELLKRELGS
ncbi:MAG TPA: hypothetical protein ENI26_13115 [Methylophaga aminisulfidivorans]|uniref:FCP1 homology domain-containing protein n=1 Tax=Methylophaga aminisulfidivorans TaxID=230105 RepID=A0A7C1ZXI1_9GAMM|nr:hypothetical protein [Methylophaga aminisulfidivorans]